MHKKKVHTFSSISDHILPKSLKCSNSGAKVVFYRVQSSGLAVCCAWSMEIDQRNTVDDISFALPIMSNLPIIPIVSRP